MQRNKLSGAMQENLMCLLFFSASGGLIRNMVPLAYWDSFFAKVVSGAYEFWDTHKTSPGEHTLDIFEDAKATNPKDAELLTQMYSSMLNTATAINEKYVLHETTKFVRHKRLRLAIAEAVELIDKDDVETAEARLSAALVGDASTVDLGVRLTDTDRMLRFLHTKDESIPTGIKELDTIPVGPSPKTICVFVAGTGKGKSWWLIHLGKQALINRKIVVHVTLEMSEEKVAARYCQSLFSMTRRSYDSMRQTEIVTDENGTFCSFSQQVMRIRPSFRDSNVIQFLTAKLTQMRTRAPLVIKQFPNGTLTPRGLEAYLDQLFLVDRITPDLLIVDYVDEMRIDRRDYRLALGDTFMDLRGIGVKRNIAIATATQANRAGASSHTVRSKDISEDWSKITRADVCITYSQTAEEERVGLARLLLEKTRDTEGLRATIVVAQNYKTGQFCLGSARLGGKYWDTIKDQTSDSKDSNRELPGA